MRQPYLAIALFCSSACATTGIMLYRSVPSTCGSGRVDLKAVTYNVGLAPGIVPLATPRTPHVARAVAGLDADLLCLQEAWTDEAKEAIRTELDLPPENILYVDTKGEGETGEDRCTISQVAPILDCMNEECRDVHPEEVTTCAVSECRSAGIGLYFTDRACLNCLIASAGKTVPDIVRSCVQKGGRSRLYDGNNGVMLASKWPLRDTEVVRLPSTGANRVALIAKIDGPGKEPIDVACTHLSAPSYVSPTFPGFDSWDDEQKAQLRIISERLRLRAGGRPSILIGDLNFGWGRESWLDDHLPAQWLESARLGFTSPAALATPAFCSSCQDNTLRNSTKEYMIDHVMVRDIPGGTDLEPTCAEPLLTDTVRITGYRGEPIDSHLSDHLAISVRFRVNE